jgi:CRISPR-associated endonuclease/helicase Cas3
MDWTIQLYKEKQEEGTELDIFNPDHCNEFFARFYSSESLDAKNIQQSRSSLNFNDVGYKFRVIEDDWSFPIVTPWPIQTNEHGEGRKRAEAFREDPNRDTARALQPYIVQVPKKAARQMEQEGIVTIEDSSIGLPTDMFDSNWYDDEFGLSFDTPSETTNAFFTE